MDKYSDIIQTLETEELEIANPGADLYTKLLASYLYQDQLYDAKHLWMRIPQSIKSDNKELERLQLLMRALLSNSFKEFFKSIHFSWSESIKEVMDDLLQKIRENVFLLVSTAYTSIYEQHLMQMTQMRREQLKEACFALGWIYDGNGLEVVVLPKRPPTVSQPCSSSEDQLFKLTEFVSFLEN